jgi:histidine triad (HIT) family protein
MKPCIFCEIASGNRQAHIVFEDNEFIAFLDYRPVNEGHVLIIPKEHYEYVFDLDDDFMARMFILAKKLSHSIKACFDAPRIGLVAEGFGVPHLHVHLVPIYQMGDLDPHRAKPSPDLEGTQKRILRFIAKSDL